MSVHLIFSAVPCLTVILLLTFSKLSAWHWKPEVTAWDSWENCAEKGFLKLWIQGVAKWLSASNIWEGFSVWAKRILITPAHIPRVHTLHKKKPLSLYSEAGRGEKWLETPFSPAKREGQWTIHIESYPTHARQPVAGMRNSTKNLGLSLQNDEETNCCYVLWTPYMEVGEFITEIWVNALGKSKESWAEPRAGEK